VGLLAAFSVKQEGALSVCEGRKDTAVRAIEDHNAAVMKLSKDLRKKVWWKL